MMYKNYLIVAWRVFLKRKSMSAINIMGISIGISFALLALLFVQDEFSFDSFHVNKDHIYQVEHYEINNDIPDMDSRNTGLPIPFGPTLKESVAGIRYFTRWGQRNNQISIDIKKHKEKIHYVDRDFFNMFTLDFIEGNAKTGLVNNNEIVINDEKAIKYFGGIYAKGKTLDIDGQTFTVAGVFRKISKNSSLDCEIIMSYEQFPPYIKQHDDWGGFYSPVFVQLDPGKEPVSLNPALEDFSRKHLSSIQKKEVRRGLILIPFGDLHFEGRLKWPNASNITYSYILSGIALLVLLVACINYILLSLSGSLSRTREIGIRKVIGATRKMIRFQFFAESLILIGLSLPIGILIVQLTLPEFNHFMNREISLFDLQGKYALLFLGIIALTGFLAGGYPALSLSSILPETILKVKSSGKHKTTFSGFLIVFQFATCFVLLICAFVMFKQMDLIQTKDLGFNKEQVLVVETVNDIGLSGKKIVNNFRTALADEKRVVNLSGLMSNFGDLYMTLTLKDSLGKENQISFSMVDFGFFETLGVPLKEGRLFSRDFPADTMKRFVVNETLAKQIGEGSVLGKPMTFSPGSEIIGVVKDFNYQSLEHEVGPMAFTMGKDYRQMFIKIQPDDIPQTLATLEATWKKIVGDAPFQFTFLDDHINRQYERYQQWTRIISISTFFAITIALMGLLGILKLAVLNRVREIGIRKVFGATVSSLLVLFSRRYVGLILIGFIVAAPLAYQASAIWLQGFVYKTDIPWWLYALPLLLILFIAMVIMAGQVIKTAKTNPVDSIRYE